MTTRFLDFNSVLRTQIQKLTNFLGNESSVLNMRPSRLEQTSSDLRQVGSPLDDEIPNSSEDNSVDIQKKIKAIIAELKVSGSVNPDRKSLNLVAYYLTSTKVRLDWSEKRTIFSTLDSVVTKRRYRSTLRSLLYGYVQFFAPKSKLTKDMARYISQRKENLNRRWRERISEFNLLEHQSLIEKISVSTLHALPTNFFEQMMSLPRNLDSSAVKLLALRNSCKLLDQPGQSPELKDKFLDTYFSNEDLQRITASFLLEPIIDWFRDAQTHDSALKERVQSIILSSFGDPRMQGGMASWPPLYLDQDGSKKRSCQEELTRWLTKDTLRLFFKAIKKTAQTQGGDSAALRHWPQRQSFWERYLNQGYIDQAWVVLGGQVSQQLDSLSSNDGLDVIKYGQFSIADNAAIIMRVGQTATVVEWSHSGAVWVCKENHKSSPKMFSTGTYQDKELRAPKSEQGVARITHDANHSWRAKLDSAIHDMTGVTLRYRYYEAFTNRR